MGWKSTVDITRKDAIKLIFSRLADINTLSDRDLGDLLTALGYGDDINLPYHGCNFFVVDKEEKSNLNNND